MNSCERLQAASALLPSLIEFYQWITTDLSSIITAKESFEFTMYKAMQIAYKDYPEIAQARYRKLFEYVKGL